jgi:hypothetical protein
MEITERDFEASVERLKSLRKAGYALSAVFDRKTSRVLIELSTGIQVAVPVDKLEGLAGADQDCLDEIEVSPSGLGLHWPRLDADLYVPALLQGTFGSRKWMAAQLGASGGMARTAKKASAARENGRKGGRPRKAASG